MCSQEPEGKVYDAVMRGRASGGFPEEVTFNLKPERTGTLQG